MLALLTKNKNTTNYVCYRKVICYEQTIKEANKSRPPALCINNIQNIIFVIKSNPFYGKLTNDVTQCPPPALKTKLKYLIVL